MKRLLLVIVSGIFIFPACSHFATSSVDPNTLQGSEWVLEDLAGRAVEDRVQSTIVFKTKDRLAGWGGCNRYFTRFRYEGKGIQIGPIGSTRRVCPAVVMDQEKRFFKALEKANRICMQEPYLLIYSENLEKPLKFTRVNRPDS